MNDQPLPGRPMTVVIALWLLFAQVAIGLLGSLYRFWSSDQVSPSTFALLVVANVAFALLYFAMSRGRRWAFVIVAVLFIVGFPKLVQAWIYLIRYDHGTGLARSVISETATIVALALLVTKSARDWFRQARIARSSVSEDLPVDGAWRTTTER